MERYYFNRVLNGLLMAIVFDFDIQVADQKPDTFVELTSNILLVNQVKSRCILKSDELNSLKKGIERIKDYIPINNDFCVISIYDAYWSWCDYQSDIWELAIIELLSKRLSFSIPHHQLSIDKSTYPFTWKINWL